MFKTREEAGKLLGDKLVKNVPHCTHDDIDQHVIAIGRGGVAVAAPIAVKLCAPLSIVELEAILDIQQPDSEIAAVSSSGLVMYNDRSSYTPGEHSYIGHRVRELATKARDSQKDWATRAGIDAQPVLTGKRVIIVDEGTVSETIRRLAAVTAKNLGAAELILVTPVVLQSAENRLERHYSAVVSLVTAPQFLSIAELYHEHPVLDDAEVLNTLTRAAAPRQYCKTAS